MHAVQFAEGTESDRKTAVKYGNKTKRVENGELQAVGLPYDHDGKKSTPNKEAGPNDVNENRFRADLGYEQRPQY
mgnify:CR=1 FL=1